MKDIVDITLRIASTISEWEEECGPPCDMLREAAGDIQRLRDVARKQEDDLVKLRADIAHLRSVAGAISLEMPFSDIKSGMTKDAARAIGAKWEHPNLTNVENDRGD